jgi:hypothetical protein
MDTRAVDWCASGRKGEHAQLFAEKLGVIGGSRCLVPYSLWEETARDIGRIVLLVGGKLLLPPKSLTDKEMPIKSGLLGLRSGGSLAVLFAL